ncbi:MAG: hypothetical protein K6E71_02455 [Lachnospiraceae bacterium]|nr:hypothetical protein [Lachnospiraceae bacterium]
MKKKWIVLGVIILVAVAVFVFLRIAGHDVPLRKFEKETQKFDQYVTEVKEDAPEKKRKRLEMSVEEYSRLKEEVLSTWGKAPADSSLPVQGFVLGEDLFTEEERSGQIEAFDRDYKCDGLFGITGNMVYEELAVNIHEDIVYLEYNAEIYMAGLFGQVK